MITRSTLVRLLAATCVLGALAVPITQASAASAAPEKLPAGHNGAFAQPDSALGANWQSSTDEVVSGAGDSDGYHVMVAKADDAYAWTNLVTLNVPSGDVGPWTGEICQTGDGKYAVAVYAPSQTTNTPALVRAGAFAATINLATGAVTPIAARVQLAYYDPGCGLDNTVVLTRALDEDEQQTQLVNVDAATGQITGTTVVKAQVTNAFHDPSGDIGVIGGALARIGANGSHTTLAGLAGRPYAVVPTSRGIDVASAVGAQAVIQHWTGKSLESLGQGPLTSVHLYPQANGVDAAVGNVSGIATRDTGMRTIAWSGPVDAISRQGGLVVGQLTSREVQAISTQAVGAKDPVDDAGQLSIAATATGTGVTASAVVAANAPVTNGTRTATPAVEAAGNVNPSATEDFEKAVDISTETDDGGSPCLIPRNSPSAQALQPTPAMVEWAVDQAAAGDLADLQRPADYLGTEQPTYSPAGMFPPVTLQPSGGSVPAQVELGILAQESNFDEASWHAVPGDSGNPLIADYYGTAQESGTADDPDYVPEYTTADCGYGIGQVTDGMSSIKPDPLSTPEATAVATDYAANIAASLQILETTWNQLEQMSPAMTLNGGAPQYIENWYLAIWGYNSGVYPQADTSENGGYGVGWFNNPANPQYPSDRVMFNDDVTTSNDAASPQLWTYEEKVMGWIEHPQVKGTTVEYHQPTFGSSETDPYYNCDVSLDCSVGNGNPGPGLDMPPNTEFCSLSVNNCNPSPSSASDPCPDDSAACWWDQPATWITSIGPATAAVQNLPYQSGAPEPTMNAQYPADCPSRSSVSGQFGAGMLVVTDLNDASQNTRGCAWANAQGNPNGNDGKFTIRLGDNISLETNPNGALQQNPMSAQIDLHQIGAGFLGHFYFTHTYNGAGNDSATEQLIPGDPQEDIPPLTEQADDVPTDIQHKVVGTWTPDITTADETGFNLWTVYASVPDHGANAPDVTYHIDYGETSTGQPSGTTTCHINQASDGNRFVDIGTYNLTPGADVWLDNMVTNTSAGDPMNGTKDVAFGSLIFVPGASPITPPASACMSS